MLDLASGKMLDNTVNVLTTSHRGFTPEEIAERYTDKIISVGTESHQAIRDQALAFKKYINHQLVLALKEAVQSDRTTLINRLRDAGHPELTTILEI